jgi:translation initiation factor eIF-2B subunit gamma
VPPSNYSALSNHLAENYSSASYPRLNIVLKKFSDGERDEDDANGSGAGPGGRAGNTETEGTARILKRFRSYIKVGPV